MQVIKRYNQHRRDLTIDMECQNCKHQQTYDRAYDDSNFWVNVVPNFKCSECSQSTNSLGLEVTGTSTKYPDGFQI